MHRAQCFLASKIALTNLTGANHPIYNIALPIPQAQSSPGSSTTASSSAKGRASPEGREMYEDHEAFRNNSIACLRAKAQEHQARLLSNNLLLQVILLLLSDLSLF